jgi:hypothetical protein
MVFVPHDHPAVVRAAAARRRHFLAAAALAPATLWPFVAAHALLIAAVALDAALARGRR